MAKKSNVAMKHLRRQLYNFSRQKKTKKTSSVLLNSVPKAGTHLLHQILLAFGYRDCEGFFASTPSHTMKLTSTQETIAAIQKIKQKELYCGHIYHDVDVAKTITDLDLPCIFLYRDPRAIFISELNYLTTMNRWHRYHKRLKDLNTEDRFYTLLAGDKTMTYHFPRFAERMKRYGPWLTEPGVLKIKFEDLLSAQSQSYTMETLLEFLNQNFTSGDKLSGDQLLEQINPRQSHTFSGLDPNRWANSLPPKQLEALNTELRDVAEEWGFQTIEPNA